MLGYDTLKCVKWHTTCIFPYSLTYYVSSRNTYNNLWYIEAAAAAFLAAWGIFHVR